MKEILTIMALIAVLFVSVQYAEAETLAIEGENENTGIFLVIEDGESLLILDDKDEEIEDSEIKTFTNGGFSLKNPNEHIAIWGAPFGESQYKIVILTSEGIQRITAEIIMQED